MIFIISDDDQAIVVAEQQKIVFQETQEIKILKELIQGPPGASNFIGLIDTPATYEGQAGLVAVVNLTEDGLIFTTAPAGTVAWGQIIGNLPDQDDLKTALDGKEPVFIKNSAFNKAFGTLVNTVAEGNHLHSGVYEPVFIKNTGFNKAFGGAAGTVSEGNHLHSGVYEPVFAKNTGFNKDLGTTAGTVAEGDHNHSGIYEPVITPKGTAFNKNFGGSGIATIVSRSDHDHAGVYEPVFVKNTGFNKDLGASAGTVSEGNHLHTGVYEPVISPKLSAFNKDFGGNGVATTVSRSDHSHTGYIGDAPDDAMPYVRQSLGWVDGTGIFAALNHTHTAASISYDNSTSNLAATDVQGGVDENATNMVGHVAAIDPHPQYVMPSELPSISVRWPSNDPSPLDPTKYNLMTTAPTGAEDEIMTTASTLNVPTLVGEWLRDQAIEVDYTWYESEVRFSVQIEKSANRDVGFYFEVYLLHHGPTGTPELIVTSEEVAITSTARTTYNVRGVIEGPVEIHAGDYVLINMYVVKRQSGSSATVGVFVEGANASRFVIWTPIPTYPAPHAVSHAPGGTDSLEAYYAVTPTASAQPASFAVSAADGFDHFYDVTGASVVCTIPTGLPLGHRFTVYAKSDTTFVTTGLDVTVPGGKTLAPRNDGAAVGFIHVPGTEAYRSFGDLADV